MRLAPGEQRTVSVVLDMRNLAVFDVAARAWTAEAGRFTVNAGFSRYKLSCAHLQNSLKWFGALAYLYQSHTDDRSFSH